MTNGGSTPEGGRVFTMETICKSEGFWAGSEKVGEAADDQSGESREEEQYDGGRNTQVRDRKTGISWQIICRIYTTRMLTAQHLNLWLKQNANYYQFN